jgi:hypothetical protein
MCRAAYVLSRLCAGPLICREAYALSRVCTEPAYVLSRFLLCVGLLCVGAAICWAAYSEPLI